MMDDERQKKREQARREVDARRGKRLSKRDSAMEQARRIAEGTEDTKGIVVNVESALDQLENAREHITMAVDELRGQTTVIKERVYWLIAELDKLRRQIEELKA